MAELLDPLSQPKFANDLPLPQRIDADGSTGLVIDMRQFQQWLGLVDAVGAPLLTAVWGFGEEGHAASYPGPTLVARQGAPITVRWLNELPVTGHLLPVDTTIHLAEPQIQTLGEGFVPTVVHLHGGHSPSGSDGLPESWFTQQFGETGPTFTTPIYSYPNSQDGATLWYHDHALGLTRLNTYAGLAGFYLLRDANETGLIDSGVIPGGSFEIEMAIQDRAFTGDGQLYIPAFPDDPIPGTTDTVADGLPPDYTANGGSFPTILPEFFGDFVLVNGMAWPKLELEPGEYRFRLLNGSDSRFYVLKVDNPEVKVTLIGTDGGLLPNAITVIDGIDQGGDGLPDPGEQLVLAPADRLDLVFDFRGVAGEGVTLLNAGPAYEPFKGLTPDGALAEEVQAATPTDPVGQIVRFNVAAGTPINNATVEDGTVLNPNFHHLSAADAVKTRQLGLFEGTDPFGRIEPQLGVAEATTGIDGHPVAFGPLAFEAPVTEMPRLGSTEIWEFFNFTEDAHPIHVHQVQFQVLGKQKIVFTDELDNATSATEPDSIPDDVNGDGSITIGPEGSDNDITLGTMVALNPEDTGAQDTQWVAPGEVLRVVARFDIPGEFVWHCHIISHEDHEMMRPYQVLNLPRDFDAGGKSDLLWQNADGLTAIWLMNGLSLGEAAVIASPPAAWHAIGTGDFDNDGTADILWQNNDGSAAIWLMDGLLSTSQAVMATPPPQWHAIDAGDFDGDGRADILWQNDDGRAAIWLMDGLSLKDSGIIATPPPEWHAVSAGDFDGDGKADILWQDDDGRAAVWLMDGLSLKDSAVIATPPPEWHVIDAGDFDGNGTTDILWQNDDGSSAIWGMNGLATTFAEIVGTPPPSWHAKGAADFNGDGKSDISWQNDDGSAAAWLMDGITLLDSAVLATPPSNWDLIRG